MLLHPHTAASCNALRPPMLHHPHPRRSLSDYGIGRKSLLEGGVGLFLLAGGAAGVALVAWARGNALRTGTPYQATIEFPLACGITVREGGEGEEVLSVRKWNSLAHLSGNVAGRGGERKGRVRDSGTSLRQAGRDATAGWGLRAIRGGAGERLEGLYLHGPVLPAPRPARRGQGACLWHWVKGQSSSHHRPRVLVAHPPCLWPQIGTPVRIRGVQVGQVLAVKPSLERVDVLVEVGEEEGHKNWCG